MLAVLVAASVCTGLSNTVSNAILRHNAHEWGDRSAQPTPSPGRSGLSLWTLVPPLSRAVLWGHRFPFLDLVQICPSGKVLGNDTVM